MTAFPSRDFVSLFFSGRFTPPAGYFAPLGLSLGSARRLISNYSKRNWWHSFVPLRLTRLDGRLDQSSFQLNKLLKLAYFT